VEPAPRMRPANRIFGESMVLRGMEVVLKRVYLIRFLKGLRLKDRFERRRMRLPRGMNFCIIFFFMFLFDF